MTATGDPPSEFTENIRVEISSLRKGRGMNASDLGSRMGPQLRALIAGAHGEDSAGVRSALSAELTALAAQLPEDLRTAILASLALSAEVSQMPKFKDRVEWLATRDNFVPRTALRRIADAEKLLAEVVARELLRRGGKAAGAPDGWYLDEFRTLLRLDTPGPQVHETRRIVSTQANLTEVMAWVDVHRDDGGEAELEIDVSFGGRLIRREHPTRDLFRFMLQLPKALQPGEMHEYGIVLRLPEGEDMNPPHYILTPEYRIDLFELRVKFSLDRLPKWVRRVEAETVRIFESPVPPTETDLLCPDPAGEVYVKSRNLTKYLGYGIKWAF